MIVTFANLGRYGRLANQMYQIAGTIGVARRNGFDFGFPPWRNFDHAERFNSTEDIDVQKHFLNPLPLYAGPALPDRFVQWGYEEVNLDQSVSLSGHMQSFKFFDHCFEEVKFYLRMVEEPPLQPVCAIHLRLGDYDGNYHLRLGMNYYEAAMREFGSEQKFLVFSDDIPGARNLFGARAEYSEGRDYLQDLRLMKRCEHFIIGNSSYSAIAAVLGEAPGKRVIAPDPWFGAVAGITGRDIYNDDWKVIKHQ